MEQIPILFAIDKIGRGGTELQLVGLINNLDRSLFRPYLLTLRAGDDSVLPRDCFCKRLGLDTLVSRRGTASLFHLVRFLTTERIKIVQTFFQDPTLLIGTAAIMARVPVRLGSFRDLGFWRTRLTETALRVVYRGLTGFIANSQAVKTHFCQRDGLDPDKVTVIYNGTDPDKFTFAAPADKPRLIGLLSNLNRDVKRADLFVEAAGHVAAAHPDARWEILGDGPQRPELERRALELGLAGRLRFLGHRADVAEVLGGWDIGVVCSDSEGLSNALLEFMLSGCAAVATAVGGNRETLTHDETGLLVPPGNARALAETIERLLNDGRLASRLAFAARARATARYSWSRCAEDHSRLYLRALSEANGQAKT